LDARGHQFSVVVPPAPVWVEGDMTRLAQVIANLLNNAAKYTEAVGTVSLTVRPEGQFATVTVRDTGVGISPELLPRIFDVFVQGNRTSERSQGGLGIGLTLARRLVELHKGKVTASSPGTGQGSEFVVALPLASAPSATGFEASRVSQVEHSSAPRRVLVVDDNRDGCETTATILRFRGYEVRCLHEGASVLQAALQWRPHAIVLDIGLPRMNGLEVAAQLRQHAEFEHVALIALTGYGQESDQLRSMRAGFDLHLTKPVDPRSLEECVARVLTAGVSGNSLKGDGRP
jgi:CheY-like chemotaxis protein/anti-sigma regulatory factor (Ser/Thr protein kinase)